MASLQEIQTMLQSFSQDRPTLQKNNTPEQIILLLQNEVVEASQSLTDTENLATEIADVVILALTLANSFGFDMDLEIREKISFNNARFSSDIFQAGSYDDAISQGKRVEKDYLKRDFYNIPR